MTQQFRESIPELCGIASALLRWSPTEFWQATPEELAMALHSPNSDATASPTREQIAQMMEDDRHG